MDEFVLFKNVELLNMHRTMLRNGVCTRSRGNSRRGFKNYFSTTFFANVFQDVSLARWDNSKLPRFRDWLCRESMRNACTEIWIEICAPHTSTSSSTGNSNYGEYYLRVVELFKIISLCLELYRSNNREYI